MRELFVIGDWKQFQEPSSGFYNTPLWLRLLQMQQPIIRTLHQTLDTEENFLYYE